MNFHLLGNYLAVLFRYHALALVASFILLSTPSHASENAPQVYTGMVGSARVVMELESGVDEEANIVRGRYFYRKYRLDIGLRGTRTGGAIVLESSNSGDRMILRRTNAGLSGSLTTKDARRLAVRLSPISANAVSTNGIHAKLTDQLPYEREQLAELELVAGDVMQHGARTLRNWREPVSGIACSGSRTVILHQCLKKSMPRSKPSIGSGYRNGSRARAMMVRRVWRYRKLEIHFLAMIFSATLGLQTGVARERPILISGRRATHLTPELAANWRWRICYMWESAPRPS